MFNFILLKPKEVKELEYAREFYHDWLINLLVAYNYDGIEEGYKHHAEGAIKILRHLERTICGTLRVPASDEAKMRLRDIGKWPNGVWKIEKQVVDQDPAIITKIGE